MRHKQLRGLGVKASPDNTQYLTLNYQSFPVLKVFWKSGEYLLRINLVRLLQSEMKNKDMRMDMKGFGFGW